MFKTKVSQYGSTVSHITLSNYKEYEDLLDQLKKDFVKEWRQSASIHDSLNVSSDNFERLRTLGAGTFGRVILVKYKYDNNYYAMKILEKAKLVKMKQVQHTFSEKRILECVHFPFIIRLELFYQDNCNLYFVFPFLIGGELFTHLKRFGRFEEKLARFYAGQITLALEYLHHMDCIHRDIKPENILLDRSGYLKLTDFGFAKIIQGRTWTLCGTPEYLAPEIIACKGYGMAADWWSLGVLVYEMAAGYSPFATKYPTKMYEKIISGRYKFPNHFSLDLKDLISHLLQNDLTRRYGNLKRGATDIKTHKWFKGFDWMLLLNRKILPPYTPQIQNNIDASNFDQYEEIEIKTMKNDEFYNEFKDF
ncbi:cAMP-dependent protein kinase catalytic subunit alpha-like [Chrysoperla carnea]|uniref:cAMP-dependent protein kinase catalytic subunit alpha-like n=1 Tax=Chrysoperla carnea TaxID=189513 RepID=UPI001D087636|nr:cAMP-dependent protein kinase catalytic subunit alpha-like [Chrysoperla carnea]